MRDINELKSLRASLLDEAKKAVDEGCKEDYDKNMKEIESLNGQIEALHKLELEDKRFGAEDSAQKTDLVNAIYFSEGKKEESMESKDVKEILASNEYARAFALALKRGVSPSTAIGEEYAPLHAVLKTTGAEPDGSDGGFLVPEDVNTMIQEEIRTYTRLADYINVENTRFPSGTRVIDAAPDKGFTKVDEYTDIPKDDQPSFKQIAYSTDKYGLIIPISNELMADSTANLMRYLSRWFAKKLVITENQLIIQALDDIEETAVAADGEFDALALALNVTLDPAISRAAKIVTNQTGFNTLATIKNDHGDRLLHPDIYDRTKQRYDDREVVIANDRDLKSTAAGAPVYVGDLKRAVTLFRRQGLRIDTTRVGGTAWNKDATEVRGIVRMGTKLMNASAAVKLMLEAGKSDETPGV